MSDPRTAAALMESPAPAAAVLRNVSKRFPGAEALNQVSLALPKGQITGLLGPNGSGKSTLLKLLAGLCRPTSGEVLVGGRVPDRQVKAQVAYMPEVDHLYPWMRVSEMLDFVRPFYADWDQKRALSLLDFMGLPAQQPVGKLSKGMRARLRLVSTLARSASLVLLDEPLSGIDVPSRSRIVEAILSQFQAGEQTILLSTHEVLETETMFDHLILLEGGRVKLEGSADDLRSQYGKSVKDFLEEVYA